MMKKVQSDFLFAQPSFASGAARVFDLWGQFDAYNESATPAEADANAIAADWAVVGQDIFDAIQQYDSEHEAA
ncbi:MAG: hypothetical protein ACYCSP_05260 [Acidobacteriaceae bacterium]